MEKQDAGNREETKRGMELGNPEKRLRYYDLMMVRDNLDGLPQYALPQGYRFVTYRPGDEENWMRIEQSAGELIGRVDAADAWRRYFAGKENEVGTRMFFVETQDGETVATATAFYEPGSENGVGWLHWVAVKKEHQGRGLSRPLIAKTLARLRELGDTKAQLHTQTTTWIAVKIYLDFGFRPRRQGLEQNEMGWRLARAVTGHDALAGFEPLEKAQWFDPLVCAVREALLAICPQTVDYAVYTEKGAYVRYRTPEGVWTRPYQWCGSAIRLGAAQREETL